jgi:hypothetical protein
MVGGEGIRRTLTSFQDTMVEIGRKAWDIVDDPFAERSSQLATMREMVRRTRHVREGVRRWDVVVCAGENDQTISIAMFIWRRSVRRKVFFEHRDLVLFVVVEFQLLIISHFEDLPVDLLSDPRDQLTTSGRPVVIVVIEIRGAVEPEQLQFVIGQVLCHIFTKCLNRLGIEIERDGFFALNLKLELLPHIVQPGIIAALTGLWGETLDDPDDLIAIGAVLLLENSSDLVFSHRAPSLLCLDRLTGGTASSACHASGTVNE